MDEASLRDALAALHPAAWAWARHCCRGDAEEAADALQSAYLAVLEGRARFGGQSSFRTWFFGVIRRSAMGRRRTRWFHRLLLERRGDELVPPAPRPAGQALEEEERVAQLESALRSLSGRQREVIELVFQHELTIEEAATVIGIPLGTARTHYARGKARLATLLRPLQEEKDHG